MRIIQIVLLVFLSAAIACSNKTVTGKEQAAAAPKEEPQKKTETSPAPEKANADSSKQKSSATDTYRFIVGFYSIGSGTEGEQMKKFDDFASEYGQKAGKQISIEKYPWGREGEADFCLKLENLPAQEQEVFISRAKTVLKDAKWVHFFENAVCKHKR